MDQIAFQKIYKSLLETAGDKGKWIEDHNGWIENKVARAYYDSNLFNINSVYVDNSKLQAIILLKKGAPIFFYNENGEKFYQLTSLKEVEGALLFVLIKTIQRDYKIMELESELSFQEDIANIYKDDSNIMYKRLYEDSLEEIEKLEKKLENKIKAYDSLKTRHELLLEKNNWEI